METQSTEPKKKKGNNLWWIILLGIVLILFSTNPSETRFKEFLKEDFKKQARTEGVGILGGPIASLAGLTTIRNDYLIFSTFEISVLGDKYQYLGILNHFTEIY
jgi:hypothetical protein